jgi:xeroderma pigmentosum group C-complementing protein
MNFSYNRDGSPSGSESEDDGMEWEEVVNKEPAGSIPAPMTGPTSDQASTSKAGITSVAGPSGNEEIQVTLKAGSTLPTSVTNSRKKGKGRPSGFSAQAALERAQRQELHKVHAACLLISGHIRNGWLNDQSLQGRLMSKVPLSLQNKFHEYSKTTHPKATDRSRLFEAAMKSLLTWWSEKFHLEDESIDREKRLDGDLFNLLTSPHSIESFPYPGMSAMLSKLSLKDRTRLLMPFASEEELQKLADAHATTLDTSSSSKKKSKPPKLPKLVSSEYGELIRNPQSLAKRAVKMAGTRDMSAQLFTALCRALDIPARLVCNLPVADYRSATKVAKDEKTIEQRTGKKRKRASGTASASASVENSFEEDNTAEDDDEAEFEEVQIPAGLPSKAFNKAAKKAGKPAESGNAAQRGPARAASRAKAKNAAQTIMSARKGKGRAASLDIGMHLISYVSGF